MNEVQRETHKGARALVAGGMYLAEVAYVDSSLTTLSARSGLNVSELKCLYPDMHALGAAILDHERASMRSVQDRVRRRELGPLDSLSEAFRAVGVLLRDDIIVRAGVRLAAEARDHFPERRLDPYKTWEKYILGNLTDARLRGELSENADLSDVARTLVLAGLNTKDNIYRTRAWDEAPEQLARSVTGTLGVR